MYLKFSFRDGFCVQCLWGNGWVPQCWTLHRGSQAKTEQCCDRVHQIITPGAMTWAQPRKHGHHHCPCLGSMQGGLTVYPWAQPRMPGAAVLRGECGVGLLFCPTSSHTHHTHTELSFRSSGWDEGCGARAAGAAVGG